MSVTAEYDIADRALQQWAKWALSDRNALGYPSTSNTGRVCEILQTRIAPDRSQMKSAIAASVLGYQDDLAEQIDNIIRALDEKLQRVLVAQYTARVDGKYSSSVVGLCRMLKISESTYRGRLRAGLAQVQDAMQRKDDEKSWYILA